MKPFEIDIDTQRRRIDIRQQGFWDIDTFERFAAELTTAYHTLHRYGGCEIALVDARAFAVQPRAVVDRFTALLQKLAPFLAKRGAVLITGQLSRFQSRNAATATKYGYFNEPEEAEQWLAQGSGQSAAA